LSQTLRRVLCLPRLAALLGVVACLALLFAWLRPAGSPVFALVDSGDLAGAQKTLAAHPDQVLSRAMGRTPLHLAVIKDKMNMVRLLVAQGADLEARDAYGNTPLHLAAHCLRLRPTRFLLERGAQVNARDDFGNTPLHHLAYGSFDKIAFQVAKMLLEHGASASARNKQGFRPSELAGFNLHYPMETYLRQAAARAGGRG